MVKNKEELITSSDEKDIESIDEPEFLKMCDSVNAHLTNTVKELREEINLLKKQYKKDIRSTKKKKKRVTNCTGFTKAEPVPDKLVTFLGLEKGATMPRTDVTHEVYKVIKDRGLVYEKDGRVLRTDAEIRKLFNLPESVNKNKDPKNKNGFTFFTFQRYMANIYKEAKTENNVQLIAEV